MKKTIEKLKSRLMRGEAESFLISAREVKGLKIVAAAVSDVDSDWLRSCGDYLRDKAENVVAVLAAVSNDKITFLATCGKKP